MSSSSSLVVASIVGLSAALQFRLTREEIAEISTRAERHAGTAGQTLSSSSSSVPRLLLVASCLQDREEGRRRIRIDRQWGICGVDSYSSIDLSLRVKVLVLYR